MTVTLADDGETATIEVRDNGPGLPEPRRLRARRDDQARRPGRPRPRPRAGEASGDRAGRDGGGAQRRRRGVHACACRTRARRHARRATRRAPARARRDDRPHAHRRRRRPRRRHPQGLRRARRGLRASPASPTAAPRRSGASSTTQPDLVLLDIYLPDLGGLEVCRRLRAAEQPRRRDRGHRGARRRHGQGRGRARGRAVPGQAVHVRDLPRQARALRRLPARAAQRGGEADQNEIDAMLGELRAPGATPLPKGLAKETLELVAKTLKHNETRARRRRGRRAGRA